MVRHFVTLFHQIVMHHILAHKGLTVVRKSLAPILMPPEEKFSNRRRLKRCESQIRCFAWRALNFLEYG
jgi:hypothetical protein